VNPSAKVVYVDADPIVVAHARALLACDKNTIAIQADIRDPASILDDPRVRAHLDFTRPIALLFMSVLHFITDAEDPAAMVKAFGRSLAQGSHLVITHAADIAPSTGSEPDLVRTAVRAAAQLYRQKVAPFTLRSREQIEALFAGFDLQDPGVVPANRWRPTLPAGPWVPVLAGVARVANEQLERNRV
jgi:SAM-dependent methyltransferase